MKKVSEKNNNQKPIWIIGIALIIFLILLAGSLIGLKISRDGLNKVAEKGEFILGNKTNTSDNYITLKDGTKVLKNEDILNAREETDGLVVTNFEIEEKKGTTYIKATVTNSTSGETVEDERISIKVFDEDGNQIEEGISTLPKLKATQSTVITIASYKDCINAKGIKVERLEPYISQEEKK